MAISEFPSIVVLPHRPEPWPAIIDFLTERFPKIDRGVWEKRIHDGKVLSETGEAISSETPYEPGMRLQYFREVENEPKIPFTAEIIYQDDRIIVADKPHFLPVNPTGPYVNECLLNRLKTETGIRELTPVNRIDMDTAGLVLFSCDTKTRGAYHQLFTDKVIQKTYEAVTTAKHLDLDPPARIQNRLVKGDPWFVMTMAAGQPNTHTELTLLKRRENQVLFRLIPVTGKKHQLRLHLSDAGFPILNDRLYPEVKPESDPDFSSPLQLLSKSISFTDPVTGKPFFFSSRLILSSAW